MTASNASAAASEQISIAEAMELLNIRGRQTLYNLIDREGLTVTRSKIGRGRGGQRVFLNRAEIENLRDADAATRTGAAAQDERAALARLQQNERAASTALASLPEREAAALAALQQGEADALARLLKASKPARTGAPRKTKRAPTKRTKRTTAAK